MNRITNVLLNSQAITLKVNSVHHQKVCIDRLVHHPINNSFKSQTKGDCTHNNKHCFRACPKVKVAFCLNHLLPIMTIFDRAWLAQSNRLHNPDFHRIWFQSGLSLKQHFPYIATASKSYSGVFKAAVNWNNQRLMTLDLFWNRRWRAWQKRLSGVPWTAVSSGCTVVDFKYSV